MSREELCRALVGPHDSRAAWWLRSAGIDLLEGVPHFIKFENLVNGCC
jgi:hypothetical protein